MTLRDVIGCLRCPVCRGGLALAGDSVRCPTGHSFDVARHGYLNLLGGDRRSSRGDTAAMVLARDAFLGAGHFDAISRDVVAECEAAGSRARAGCIVDLGAGTGHHLAQVLDRLPHRTGLALDISKHALRRAARAHRRIGAVACDAWGTLPVRTGAAAVLLSIFAPRNASEIGRLLRPDGTLVMVAPTPCHLSELVKTLGLLTVDERKQEQIDQKLSPFVTPVRRTTREGKIALGHEDIETVVAMGPSAYHVDGDAVAEQIGELPAPVTVTVSVMVSVYRCCS